MDFNEVLNDVFTLKLTVVTFHVEIYDRRTRKTDGMYLAEFVETSKDEGKMINQAMDTIKSRLDKLGYDVTFYTTPASLKDCAIRPEAYI